MNEFNIIEINKYAFDPSLVKGWYTKEVVLGDDEDGIQETYKELVINYDNVRDEVNDPDDLILIWMENNLRKIVYTKEDILNTKSEISPSELTLKTRPLSRGKDWDDLK